MKIVLSLRRAMKSVAERNIFCDTILLHMKSQSSAVATVERTLTERIICNGIR